jgi:methanogenic corrinoid protein MtbC1
MLIMVSGGLFKWAEGLWQEMEADLYAETAADALQIASGEKTVVNCEKRTINRRKKRRQTKIADLSIKA